MRAIVAIVISIALALVARQAIACKCVEPPPPKIALADSAAVFSGKVVKKEQVGRSLRVTFDVDRAWKGVDARQVVVSTPRDSAACGVDFREGKRYLVYCHGQKEKLTTSLCTRTKGLKSAADEIKELGDGQRP